MLPEENLRGVFRMLPGMRGSREVTRFTQEIFGSLDPPVSRPTGFSFGFRGDLALGDWQDRSRIQATGELTILGHGEAVPLPTPTAPPPSRYKRKHADSASGEADEAT